MNIDLLYKPESAVAKVSLDTNESIIAESGAMVCMSKNITMETKTDHSADGGEKKGMLAKASSLGKRMLSGESLFQNKFTASEKPGEILLAPTLPGDIVVMEIPTCGLFLQNSAYIACTPGSTVAGQFGGLKSFLSLTGLFILKAVAPQPGETILFGSFGAVHELECDGSLTVDNGHLVAWEGSLEFTTNKACSGIIASYFSGEGIVCNFQGQGRIWIQTRQPTGLGSALSSHLSSF